jgi:hypothetical protein
MLLSLLPSYYVLALTLAQDNAAAEIGDLGKLLFVGVAGAIVVAIAFTFIRLHLRDKKPPVADFISINSFQEKK